MKSLLVLIGLFALLGLVILVVPFITQWAWANSITSIFNVREITWTEAFALNLLGTMTVRGGSFRSGKKD